jgi:1-acyl-sn-glycerol-3-phosphate acyltransferase
VEADVPVLPVALRYRNAQGKPSSAPAYAGDTTFWDCLRAITLSTGLRAELEFLPPLPAGLDRRELASRAEHDLACALGLSIGSASADTSTSSTHSPEASAADGLAS